MVEEKIINVVGVDYIVSSDGHVYSTKNIGRGKYHKEIKQRKNADGYMDVTVGPNNFRTTRKVHRLVAQAFLPPPLDDTYEIDHKDRDRSNNDVSNLQWVTHKENVEKIPHEVGSLARRNSNNGRAILNEEQVVEIRQLYESGQKNISELAREYQVGWTTISHIIKYETWNKIN